MQGLTLSQSPIWVWNFKKRGLHYENRRKVSISYMGMEHFRDQEVGEKELVYQSPIWVWNSLETCYFKLPMLSINLRYGYGTLWQRQQTMQQREVSISYMGMEQNTNTND